MVQGGRWCRVGGGVCKGRLEMVGRDGVGGRRRRDGAGREAAWAMAQARAVLRRWGKTVRGGRQQGRWHSKGHLEMAGARWHGAGTVGARRGAEMGWEIGGGRGESK